jgi:hypothetical protein
LKTIVLISLKSMPVILIAGMLFFACSGDKKMSAADALKAVKALDSDLTNFMDAAGENTPVEGITFLVNEPSSPFNDRTGITGRVLSDSMPPVSQWFGLYEWRNDSSAFTFTPHGDGMELLFPSSSSEINNLSLKVIEIGCHPFFTKPCFPDAFQVEMKEEGRNILAIDYHAGFSGTYPSDIDLKVEGEEFNGHFTASRTQEGNRGTVTAKFEFKAKGFTVLEGIIRYEIGYNGDQIFLRTVEPDFRLFDVSVNGKLDYTRVDPTSKDYIGSFNDNCRIRVTDHTSNRVIGLFGLGTDETGELLEWVIRLDDGPDISLYDHILAFRKIMDYKYPNKI